MIILLLLLLLLLLFLSLQFVGHIRSLCVTQDGTSMAVGFSSGFLSLVDLRGGILTRQWKAHEADIMQVRDNSHIEDNAISFGF